MIINLEHPFMIDLGDENNSYDEALKVSEERKEFMLDLVARQMSLFASNEITFPECVRRITKEAESLLELHILSSWIGASLKRASELRDI